MVPGASCGNKLAPDGGDPAVAKLRGCAAAAGLSCKLVVDGRPKHTFAVTGQRYLLEMRHRPPSG